MSSEREDARAAVLRSMCDEMERAAREIARAYVTFGDRLAAALGLAEESPTDEQ